MYRFTTTVTFLIILVTILSAQAPGGTPFRIERLDPALDDIVAPDTKLEFSATAEKEVAVLTG